MGYGKWISGAIGWALGGPLGALLGYGIASFLEKDRKDSSPHGGTGFSRVEERNSFLVTLLVFSSAVMKADGRVMRSELMYVKAFLKKNFGDDAAAEAIKYLKEVLKKEVDIQAVGAQVSRYMSHDARMQLLHYLTGIAAADGVVSQSELRILRQIALSVSIPLRESESIFAMFDSGVDKAYKVLEISPDATDEEVKRAYKRLAVKHHPDKVSHLGVDIQQAAEERFKKISEAYEVIRKERGL